VTYEEDYAYHLLMYGNCFRGMVKSFIEDHPNVEDTVEMAKSTSKRNGAEKGEVGKKAHLFYLRWLDDPRCMSERTKIFVSLFEEN
jgi:hypothetical protein